MNYWMSGSRLRVINIELLSALLILSHIWIEFSSWKFTSVTSSSSYFLGFSIMGLNSLFIINTEAERLIAKVSCSCWQLFVNWFLKQGDSPTSSSNLVILSVLFSMMSLVLDFFLQTFLMAPHASDEVDIPKMLTPVFMVLQFVVGDANWCCWC